MARPRPRPWNAGSTAITKISPIGGAWSGCTLVQQNAASAPSMSWSRKPFGSNQGSASRSAMSSRVHAPCSGWVANARLFTRSHVVLVLADDERAQREPVGGDRELGSTGSGRRIWNSWRSSRRPCSAATARSAAPASSDHQWTAPPPCDSVMSRAAATTVERTARRSCTPGSTSTLTLHVSLPRSACAFARRLPTSSRAHTTNASSPSTRRSMSIDLTVRGYGVDTLVRDGPAPNSEGKSARDRAAPRRGVSRRGVCARLREPLRAAGGHDPVGADAPTSG